MPTPTPRVSVRTRRVALITLAVISFSLVIAATIVTYQRHQPPVQRINYSQLYSLAEVGGAIALQVEGETLTVTRSDGSLVEATVTGEVAAERSRTTVSQEQCAGRVSAGAAGLSRELAELGCCRCSRSRSSASRVGEFIPA